MRSLVSRAMFPDRPPTKSDVLMIFVAIILILSAFPLGDAAWEWIVVGFVLGLIGMGPVAQSPIGKEIGATFQAIGVAGRIVVMSILIVPTIAVAVTLPRMFVGLSIGILAVFPLYVVGHLIVAGEIDGWRVDPKP
ncbi:hypothetical protein [Natronobacterium texcoconense]|uniref:Uncharacterized protein n=1 Tax=Natronobacterium texcoconense TaxID=1095778 RepID=A0A1H1HSN8_NATTX|nr:hypothetical protein [Natronobacterium texcoconense]SDR28412.1 hypothetical protein SAMN04489842_3012 [Natronobacterium texcoconense]